MATASAEVEDQKTSLTGCPKRKSVQIKEDATQIIEIKEKHGPLYNAIPCMVLPLAAFCCVINILIPGFGTLISAFSVFCGSTTRIGKRFHAFCLNVLCALLQMLTFIFIVGWIWSILWGMNFVQLSLTRGNDSLKVPYYVRRQSSIE
ncbi:hypothetical protein ScPMuIL_014258 [Solemya velum]